LRLRVSLPAMNAAAARLSMAAVSPATSASRLQHRRRPHGNGLYFKVGGTGDSTGPVNDALLLRESVEESCNILLSKSRLEKLLTVAIEVDTAEMVPSQVGGRCFLYQNTCV